MKTAIITLNPGIDRIMYLPGPARLGTLNRAERVVVELNGMHQAADFYLKTPEHWKIAQEVMFADSTTFLSYNANMRQLVVDKLAGAELVIFNRVPVGTDIIPYHKIARAVNRKIDIIYDYTDGTTQFDEIEDPLPFDLNAPVIEIADEDYALFYRDLVENVKGYSGKIVRFKGIVAKDKSMASDTFVIGRHVMTCCEADIAYKGLICVSDAPVALKNRDWVIITAQIKLAFHKLYGAKGPVLFVQSIETSEKPEEEVATFW